MQKEIDINPKKIFIVDDDPKLLEEIEYALVMAGHAVTISIDACSVVKTADEIKPDIIVLDIKMEGKTGFQVADDLKHFPGTAAIPILAMTGCFTEPQHLSFMKRCGIDDCIVKPIDPYEMMLKIESMV
ncbi:MAG: response regulator [Endomicrobiales bacterium]|jgi:two-component system alkaline phosphatase synthesis response regulator PhoP